MACQLIWEPRGVYRRFCGLVTAKELTKSLTDVGADIRFDDLRYSIFDCLEMNHGEFQTDELETVAANLLGGAYTNPRISVALVTRSDMTRVTIQRFNALKISPYVVEVFPALIQARDWIARQLPVKEMHLWAQGRSTNAKK